MACYLLHIMEDPDRDAYRDPDLKDVVGLMPRFFCAHCQPIKQLLPTESLRCMDRGGPCWKPAELICDNRQTVPGPVVAQPGEQGGGIPEHELRLIAESSAGAESPVGQDPSAGPPPSEPHGTPASESPGPSAEEPETAAEGPAEPPASPR